MCGRYTITADKVEFILKRFQAELAPGFGDYSPRYNAAPAQLVPGIVSKEDGKRYLTHLYWGLTPPWAEKEGSKYSTQINIRNDTIEKNKFFRSLLLSQRCIFVADGFYEWQAPKGSQKNPLPNCVQKWRSVSSRRALADNERRQPVRPHRSNHHHRPEQVDETDPQQDAGDSERRRVEALARPGIQGLRSA